jgi:hypothetical protein
MSSYEFNTHQEFFESQGDSNVILRGWGVERTISVEELYAHFVSRLLAEETHLADKVGENQYREIKERLISEIKVSVPRLKSTNPHLIDSTADK